MKSKENQGDNNETKKINFKNFVNLYPSIDEIKNFKEENNEGSLAFLKEFYVKVWGIFSDYAENDILLYDLFSKENDIQSCINQARIGILETMYSTNINKVGAIIEIVDEFSPNNKKYRNDESKKCQTTPQCDNSKDQFTKNCVDCAIEKIREKNKNNEGKPISEVLSFFSKYCHWYNEANGFDGLPIYDKNVAVGVVIYKYFLNENSDKNLTNSKLKKELNIKIKGNDEKLDLDLDYVINKAKENLDYNAVNNAINELFIPDKKVKRVDIKNNELLYNNISIYRLVDKFLWLSYKIVEQLLKPKKTNTLGSIPIEVTISYLELLAKVKNKEKEISKLINKIKEINNQNSDSDKKPSQNKLKKERNQKITNIKNELQKILEKLNTPETQQSIAIIDETPTTQLQKTLEL